MEAKVYFDIKLQICKNNNFPELRIETFGLLHRAYTASLCLGWLIWRASAREVRGEELVGILQWPSVNR